VAVGLKKAGSISHAPFVPKSSTVSPVILSENIAQFYAEIVTQTGMTQYEAQIITGGKAELPQKTKHNEKELNMQNGEKAFFKEMLTPAKNVHTREKDSMPITSKDGRIIQSLDLI